MKSRKPTSIRLTPDQKKRLKQLARERRTSEHAVIQDLLQPHLEPTKGHK